MKLFTVDDLKCRVEFWDLPGASRHHKLIPHYCAGATAAIVVYDVTTEESFVNVSQWVDMLPSTVQARILLGNKIKHPSRERVVLSSEGAALASTHKMAFAEADSLSGAQVDRAMETAVGQVVRLIPQPAEPALLLKSGVSLGKDLLSSADFKSSLFSGAGTDDLPEQGTHRL